MNKNQIILDMSTYLDIKEDRQDFIKNKISQILQTLIEENINIGEMKIIFNQCIKNLDQLIPQK